MRPNQYALTFQAPKLFSMSPWIVIGGCNRHWLHLGTGSIFFIVKSVTILCCIGNTHSRTLIPHTLPWPIFGPKFKKTVLNGSVYSRMRTTCLRASLLGEAEVSWAARHALCVCLQPALRESLLSPTTAPLFGPLYRVAHMTLPSSACWLLPSSKPRPVLSSVYCWLAVRHCHVTGNRPMLPKQKHKPVLQQCQRSSNSSVENIPLGLTLWRAGFSGMFFKCSTTPQLSVASSDCDRSIRMFR